MILFVVSNDVVVLFLMEELVKFLEVFFFLLYLLEEFEIEFDRFFCFFRFRRFRDFLFFGLFFFVWLFIVDNRGGKLFILGVVVVGGL